MYIPPSAHPLSRRSLLRGMVGGVGTSILAACGHEPSGAAGATNASPTPAPTRGVAIFTPLPTPDLSVTPTAIPPRPVQLHTSTERGAGGESLKFPGSLAFDARSFLHVCEQGGGDRVQVFDRTGDFVRSWGTAGAGDGQFTFGSGTVDAASAIAIAGDGAIYIGDTTGHVQVFDGGGRFLCKWGGPGGDGEVRRVGGLAIDGRDTVYVADVDTQRIQMFDPGGQFLGTWGGPGQFARPRGIDIDREGNILICDAGNNRIQMFDRDRRFVRSIGRYGVGDGELALPRGGGTGRRGDIYVADKGNDQVQKFTADGRFIARWIGFGNQGDRLSAPNSVRVDVQGDVWVADAGRILLFKQ